MAAAGSPPSGTRHGTAGDGPALHAPLAERLRPARLSEVIGQRHLVGPGMPLSSALASGRMHSMILWGPPGVGKTTLARLIAASVDADFIALSAVLSGVKDIREAVERAQSAARAGRRTLLFVDEVHRFNKSQQDAFLPHVESGLITFIGATTENPSFEMNSALLSRAQVYVLKPLSHDELVQVVERALAALEPHPPIGHDARELLIGHADGDARRLINLVDQVVAVARASAVAAIDQAFAQKTLAQSVRRFDKGGDQFYDQISALHKSVRGSSPDAALYWLVRMLDGGADPRYLARRIVRMAVEDIGLADPRAWRIALDAAETWERLGSPEGDLALANAVVYLACAAKSNAAYRAFNEVRALVAQDETRPVPMHLRNAPTKLMKSLGHGEGYRYAHDEADGHAAGERYLPDGLDDRRFYHPVARGLEAGIAEKLARLRERDAAARGGAVHPPDAAGDGSASD
ncbi:MAG: replication-associated recombination protein A [Betaproteobacteria bacterium]|nr:replication-associated recombination protein A [Betaproteobacteria bacterium]